MRGCSYFTRGRLNERSGSIPMDLIHHHGYALKLEPFGQGVRISIFAPGEMWCLSVSPAHSDPAKAIAEATAIVDADHASTRPQMLTLGFPSF